MSVAYLCDGCGASSMGELPTLGSVARRHYCAKCMPIAEGYMREIEALRAHLASQFKEDKDVLRARYRINGFRLPDEPDQ